MNIEMDWGTLEWFAGREVGNSETMTFGRCVIFPGKANPRHYHPNCDEILHVVTGRVRHSLGDDYVELGAGDTISIPTGTVHNAECISDEPAVAFIAFSSADREFVAV